MTRIFVFVLYFFSIFFVTLDAYAQEVDIFKRFRIPMPELERIPEDEFIKKTRPVRKMPYGQRELAFSMRIPEDWTESEVGSGNFVLDNNLLLELASFYGKPSPFGRARVEVNVLKMEGYLTVEQWYLKHVLASGFTVEGFTVHDKNKVESLMVHLEEDRSYYLRSVISLNGDVIVMVQFYVPIAFYKDMASMQAQILESFEFDEKVEREIESLGSYRFLDVAEISFPDTWNVFSVPLRNVDRMKVSLLNMSFGGNSQNKRSGITEGRVDVRVISNALGTTLGDEIKTFKKTLESEGMLVGDELPSEDEFSYDDSLSFHVDEVYEAMDSANNMGRYEIWFNVMVGGNYYFIVTMLTPSRNDRFAIWAENAQAYKIMISNFKAMSGAFLERSK